MIDLKRIEEIGHSLPKERCNPAPGFICLYTAPDGEHCIVGEICNKLGLEVPTCDSPDNKVAVGFLAVNGRWTGLFTTEAIVWAATAQVFGQLGYPWSVCVKVADNAIAPEIKL